MNRRHFFILCPPPQVQSHCPSLATAQTTRQNCRAPPLFDNLAPRCAAGTGRMCFANLRPRELPAGARGVLSQRPGSVRARGQRYSHWFDGDGLVHAWRFTDQGVSHRARFVAPASSRQNRKPKSFCTRRFRKFDSPQAPGARSGFHEHRKHQRAVLLATRYWRCGKAVRLCAGPQHAETRGVVDLGADLRACRSPRIRKIEPDGVLEFRQPVQQDGGLSDVGARRFAATRRV